MTSVISKPPSLPTITREQFDVAAVAKDSLFEQQVEQLRQGIIEQDYVEYTQNAYRLYQTLVEPMAEKLGGKNLLIIPDAAICSVPFEALLTNAVSSEGGLPDYPKLPFLVKDHAISYAYSATLLSETLKRKKTQAKRDYVAFAPVFPDGIPAGTRGGDFFKESLARDSLRAAPRLRGYLPASRKEVAGIFEVFKNRSGFFERLFGGKSHVYLESEASEANAKSQTLRDYRYVHFATHGLINEKSPRLSGLVLAQDTTSTEDSILQLAEIYNLSLDADLVVLSACETGLGQIAKGEGIIGLTRGFLYAGASNLLVSLWQVSDVTTADLMVDFYDRMLKGAPKARALQEAKKELLRRRPEYANPYYWAPFVLVGR